MITLEDYRETTGICGICKQKLTQKGRNRHLISCASKHLDTSNGDNYFLLSIEGKYNPEYWLNILFNMNWPLKKLDSFLRNIWLECCGHLSAFNVYGTVYSVQAMREFKEFGMNHKIKDAVKTKDKFTHIYDFGTSTELVIKVISSIKYDKILKNPEIVARNEMPEIKCNNCDNIATNICCECVYDGSGWLCDKCAEQHECGEDMLLPVVNSPRVGVCAYSG